MPGLSSLSGRAEVLWICAALSDADRAAARQDPDGRRFGIETGGASSGRTSVRALDIPADTFQGAYNAVANATLWFVHHLLFDTPVQPHFGPAFRRDWQSYIAYNEAFASALARGAAPEPAAARVLVQDYHLALVPRMRAVVANPASAVRKIKARRVVSMMVSCHWMEDADGYENMVAKNQLLASCGLAARRSRARNAPRVNDARAE